MTLEQDARKSAIRARKKADDDFTIDDYGEVSYNDDDDKPQFWRYYKVAKSLLNLVHGYYFEISSAIPGGYRWLKKLERPANNLKDLTGGKTRYLSAKLSAADYEEIQDQILETNECQNDFKLFLYILPVICLGEGDDRSKIRRAIREELNMADASGHNLKILHSTGLTAGDFIPAQILSFVPELPQFPTALVESGLKWSDFLSWFYGPAEMETLALHVGRAATGPQGGQLMGEDLPLAHSYRSAIIIKGQPLIGKSLFNNFLIAGFEFCNMATATIQDLGTRFGHDEWLVANWAYADDTTRKLLDGFYTSPVLKTACSNGIVKTENKGVDSIAVKAICAPILLANDTDSRDFAKADSGNANRIKTLSTVQMETAKGWNWGSGPMAGCRGAMPGDVIDFLTNKYRVSEELLAAYFIRLCVDHFRSFTMDELLDKVNELTEGLYSQGNATSMQDLANAAVFAMRCATGADPAEADTWANKYNLAGNSTPFILDSLIALGQIRCVGADEAGYKFHAALFRDYIDNGKPSNHPYRGFQQFSFTTIIRLCGAIKVHRSKTTDEVGLDSTSLTETMKYIFGSLIDAQGVSMSYSLATLQEKWRGALNISWDNILRTAQRVEATVSAHDPKDLYLYRNKGKNIKALEGQLAKEELVFDENKSYSELTYVDYEKLNK